MRLGGRQTSDIEVLLEHEAVEVDAAEKKVRFGNGAELEYTRLVVATGTRWVVDTSACDANAGFFRVSAKGHGTAEPLILCLPTKNPSSKLLSS